MVLAFSCGRLEMHVHEGHFQPMLALMVSCPVDNNFDYHWKKRLVPLAHVQSHQTADYQLCHQIVFGYDGEVEEGAEVDCYHHRTGDSHHKWCCCQLHCMIPVD